MPTLRDHVRDALSASAPTDLEADADLKRILAGARRKRRRPSWRWIALPAAAAAAAFVHFGGRSESDRLPSASAGTGGEVRFYLRVNEEPEERALAFRIDSKGAR